MIDDDGFASLARHRELLMGARSLLIWMTLVVVFFVVVWALAKVTVRIAESGKTSGRVDESDTTPPS